METITKILLFTITALLVLSGCTKGPSPNLCPTVCDGLVAYYPFYGDATDKSGNGHDGKVIGATLTKDRNGYQNHAYSFDGNSSGIELPLSSHTNTLEQSDYSLVAWVKPESKPPGADGEGNWHAYGIIHNFKGYGLRYHYRPTLEMSNNIYYTSGKYKNWGGQQSGYQNPGKYYHVAGVVSVANKTTMIYINGKVAGSGSERKNYWGADSIPDPKKIPAPWYVGALNPKGTKAQHKGILDGVIDEVRLYNRALSSTEVKELYLFTSAFPPTE